MARPSRAWLLALALALAGCPAPTGQVPTGAAAGRRQASPGAVAPATTLAPTAPGSPGALLPLPAAALAGAVRLLVPRATLVASTGGGVISDNGGGVVSNNSGAIVVNQGGNGVANQGGNVVANNGGNVVANNGGNVVAANGSKLAGPGGAAYRLAQAAEAPVALGLAEARVVACDAAGSPLRGADGQELAATTDAAGRYRFATLPGQGVVLRVELGARGLVPGGTLRAIAPRDRAAGGELAIDTTSTLSAAYVLGKYVQGKQETLDRLPTAAAERLTSELNASGALASAPAYQDADLVGRVEGLRGQAQALDQALEAIRALLLGQLGGGDGRQASTVAMAGPRGLVRLADGRLLIGERSFGRIRTVAPDGTVGTYADILRGHIKQNFPVMRDVAGTPDGTLYVASGFRVWQITPAGAVSVVAGGLDGAAGPVGVAATATTMSPSALLVGPDGTLYIGEGRYREGETGPARVLAVGADGIAREVPYDPGDTGPGRICGMCVGRDGTLYVLKWSPANTGRLIAYKPGAAPVVRYEGLQMNDIYGGVAEAPDGSLYVALYDQLIRLAADGTRAVLAGRGGPAALAGKLRVADSLLLEPDGTLLIGDAYFNVVHALRPDGSLSIVAGTTSAVAGGAGLADVALAAPGGVAFGPGGRLAIAPRDGRELEIFHEGRVTPWLGLDAPADVGAVGYPSGLAYHGSDLYVLDEGNHRLLKVTADGAVTKLVGYAPDVGPIGLDPGERRPAAGFPATGVALAVDAQGRPYWVSGDVRQVYRLAADGMVELVAGKRFVRPAGGLGEPTAAEVLSTAHGDGGPARDATLVKPNGLAFDLNGDLLVVDAALGMVKRISGLDGPSPTIHRLYGRTPAEFLAANLDPAVADAEPDPATVPFYVPLAIAVAPNGDRFVTELGTVAVASMSVTQVLAPELAALLPSRYARVRKITQAGTITTIAGPGGRYFADPVGPDALQTPMALAVAADGRLAICDNAANLVRILPAGTY